MMVKKNQNQNLDNLMLLFNNLLKLTYIFKEIKIINCIRFFDQPPTYIEGLVYRIAPSVW